MFYKIKKTTNRVKTANIYRVTLGADTISEETVETKDVSALYEKYEELNRIIRKERIEEANEQLSTATKIVHSGEQGSDEWKIERLGLITSSNTPFNVDGTAIPTIKKYARRKASEYFSFNTLGEELRGHYSSPAMKRGTHLEDEAIEEYSIETMQVIERKPLVELKELGIGDSIDGEVPSLNKGIEVKCPETLEPYLRQKIDGTYIDEYRQQIYMHLLVNGYDSVDFVVYYPKMKLLIQTVERDDDRMVAMMETIKKFNHYYEEALAVLNESMA